MIFEVFGCTDRGRCRETNEDAFLIMDLGSGDRLAGLSVVPGKGGDAALACAVADGMGGARAGEVASGLAIDTVRDELAGLGTPLPAPQNTLRRSIECANEVVFGRSEQDPACRGMGTTLTGVLITSTLCYIGHVGDSRAYLHHGGVLRQLTRDHSLMNFLIDHGVMSDEQAESMVNRNIILEALGVRKAVNVDTGSLTLHPGDTVLLCTDGLNTTVEDEEMGRILAAEQGLDRAAGRLVDEANRRGGPDNITVVLCRLRDSGGA